MRTKTLALTLDHNSAPLVAITGASGHIGYHVCKSLLASGYRVRALIRQEVPYLTALPIDCIRGDLLDKMALHQLMEGADAAIHLAARIVLDSHDRQYTRTVNIDGVDQILQVCLTNKVKRLVHFSSIHAYISDKTKPVMDESNPLALHSPILYEQTKATAQQRAIAFASTHPLEIVVLNPTAVIGPEDFKPSRTGKALADMYAGKLPFLPDGGFNFVDVRDVADAAVRALTQGQSGESYLLAGQFSDWRHIGSIIRSHTNTRLSLKTLPLSVLKPVGSLMEWYGRMTGNSPIFTREAILHLEHAHPQVSAKKAREKLGFQSRPLSETIIDTIDWLIENDFVSIRKKQPSSGNMTLNNKLLKG